MQLLVHTLVAQAHDVEQLRAPVGDARLLRKPDQMARTRRIELDVLVVLAAEGSSATAVNASGWGKPLRIRVCTGVTDDREHRVKHWDLDPLADAGAFAGDQRHDDPRRAEKRAEVGRQCDGRVERPRPIPAARIIRRETGD